MWIFSSTIYRLILKIKTKSPQINRMHSLAIHCQYCILKSWSQDHFINQEKLSMTKTNSVQNNDYSYKVHPDWGLWVQASGDWSWRDVTKWSRLHLNIRNVFILLWTRNIGDCMSVASSLSFKRTLAMSLIPRGNSLTGSKIRYSFPHFLQHTAWKLYQSWSNLTDEKIWM